MLDKAEGDLVRSSVEDGANDMDDLGIMNVRRDYHRVMSHCAAVYRWYTRAVPSSSGRTCRSRDKMRRHVVRPDTSRWYYSGVCEVSERGESAAYTSEEYAIFRESVDVVGGKSRRASKGRMWQP